MLVIPVKILRPFEIPSSSASGIVIKNKKVPDGTYIFIPETPMTNGVIVIALSFG